MMQSSRYSSTHLSRSLSAEPDYPYIHDELKRPHVNLRLLWSEYRDQQPEGLAYSQFCSRYNEWAAKTKAVMHIDHKPGEEMFVDCAGSKMQVLDRETSGSACLKDIAFNALRDGNVEDGNCHIQLPH